MRRRTMSRSMSSRRSVQWGSFSLAPINIAIGGNQTLDITPGGITTLNALGVPTITRVRGIFRIVMTGIVSGNDCYGAAGLIVARPGAVLLNPFGTDAGLDWIWHKYFWCYNLSGSSVESRMQDFEIDTKSMRKIRDTDSLQLIVAVNNAATSAARFFASGRVLVKRP